MRNLITREVTFFPSVILPALLPLVLPGPVFTLSLNIPRVYGGLPLSGSGGGWTPLWLRFFSQVVTILMPSMAVFGGHRNVLVLEVVQAVRSWYAQVLSPQGFMAHKNATSARLDTIALVAVFDDFSCPVSSHAKTLSGLLALSSPLPSRPPLIAVIWLGKNGDPLFTCGA